MAFVYSTRLRCSGVQRASLLRVSPFPVPTQASPLWCLLDVRLRLARIPRPLPGMRRKEKVTSTVTSTFLEMVEIEKAEQVTGALSLHIAQRALQPRRLSRHHFRPRWHGHCPHQCIDRPQLWPPTGTAGGLPRTSGAAATDRGVQSGPIVLTRHRTFCSGSQEGTHEGTRYHPRLHPAATGNNSTSCPRGGSMRPKRRAWGSRVAMGPTAPGLPHVIA